MYPSKSDLSLEDIFGVVVFRIDGSDKGGYVLDETCNFWVRSRRGLVSYGLLNGMGSIRSECKTYAEQSVNKVQRVDVAMNGRTGGYLGSSRTCSGRGVLPDLANQIRNGLPITTTLCLVELLDILHSLRPIWALGFQSVYGLRLLGPREIDIGN